MASVGKKYGALIPALYFSDWLFSWTILLEMLVSMSAKPTVQLPLCHSVPAITSKSYIATKIYISHLSANQGLYLALVPGC